MLIVGKLVLRNENVPDLKAFGFCFVHLRKYFYQPMHIIISEQTFFPKGNPPFFSWS